MKTNLPEKESSNQAVSLNANFWDVRYMNRDTGWDVKKISNPLKCYIDQLESKTASILIPGCGNSYEAEYLLSSGFQNITLVDISKTLIETLKLKFDHTVISLKCQNFFDHKGSYDLILEQTFFCAIDPSLRTDYVRKMNELLALNGKLVGLLFNRAFEKQGPPFGGHKMEYKNLFSPYFSIATMEECYNSIESRAGTELFINLKKNSIN